MARGPALLPHCPTGQRQARPKPVEPPLPVPGTVTGLPGVALPRDRRDAAAERTGCHRRTQSAFIQLQVRQGFDRSSFAAH